MAELTPYPGTPRWVKIVGIITLVLVLLVGVMGSRQYLREKSR